MLPKDMISCGEKEYLNGKACVDWALEILQVLDCGQAKYQTDIALRCVSCSCLRML